MVGLSGGVDSSVATFLLKEAGYHVEAVFMKNWQEDDQDINCSITADLADARAICEKLNVKLHEVNFTDTYWKNVFTHFLYEYRRGRTPNPDVLCNKEIKFKAFLDYAKKSGADYIATGHYVRTERINDKVRLLKATDTEKDQSYFLHALTESQLAQSLFPIGHLHKQEVRSIARRLGFQNHGKKDSTGICFIGERKFKTFLSEYLPAEPGIIETIEGRIIGKHDGLMFYTIGQRQGLQIGGQKESLNAPWYVADKDLKRNVLIVVQGEHPRLFKKKLTVKTIHWINPNLKLPTTTQAKIRYRQPDEPCVITPIKPSVDENDYFEINFENPQRAITPGQSIVFYQDDICLGGGIIES